MSTLFQYRPDHSCSGVNRIPPPHPYEEGLPLGTSERDRVWRQGLYFFSILFLFI